MSSGLLRLVQAALDRALRLDPEAGAILAPLTGKRIAVQIDGALPARWVVEFSHGRILLTQWAEQAGSDAEPRVQSGSESARVPDNADVSIRGSLSALAMLARGTDDLPSSVQVSVRGDIELLQRARIAVARLRPDFDEPLARALGDELAFPLSRALRGLASVARRTARELGDDVQEFLGEESELLAARDDVQDFGDEVDRLRDALARLDKRVSRVAGSLDRTAK
jgi:ubiquinone biosynthesis protein UbiJ